MHLPHGDGVMTVDLVVLGSGFAGSLCALIADRIGLSTVLLDRTSHPRFAVGESSTPIADMILRDLADRYDLERLKPLATWGTWQMAYPELRGGMKRGFSYYRHEAGAPFAPDPEHENELLVAASPNSERSDAHWYRADVDAFFAREVRRAGVPFYEDVTPVPRSDGDRWRLDAVGVEADFVIDATGAGGALPDVLELPDRKDRIRTRTRSLYSHFRGVPRWLDALAARGARVEDYPYDPDWSALHHLLDGGWLWMLRFKNDVVSAGLVLDEAYHPPDLDTSPEDEWRAHLGRYPSLRDLFGEADPAPLPGRLIRTGRLQRRVGRAAGRNWALLPSTAGFVDPLHSVGIAHSMSGVERLMRILEESWGRSEFTGRIEGYGRGVLRELDFIDGLVFPCYAAIDSFPLWSAATMIYFAAATTYERRRIRDDGLFLLADDEKLASIVREAPQRLEEGEFETWLVEALRPYNEVGLFRPRVKNMYEHTAAPK